MVMHTSLWEAVSPQTNFPVLEQDKQADIAIVGGGITGVTCARLLAQSGKKVVILEAAKIGSGTTGYSTGNLYAMVDKRLHHIQSKWDKKTAGMVAESRAAAIGLVEKLVEDHALDCEFRRVPWYLFSETNKKDETIEKEMETARDYGLPVEEVKDLPLPFRVSRAMRVDNQAQFNPSAFVKGLAAGLPAETCRIYENSPVTEIINGDMHVLKTPKGSITARKVIQATHTPKGVHGLHMALYPYREYGIAVKLKSGPYPEGIFWDTESKAHHSIRSFKSAGEDYLVVVGGHHKVGQEDHYKRFTDNLEAVVRGNFDVAEVSHRWSAQHYKPADGLPYIGETSHSGMYVATGFSTDGLTYGVLSAMILHDLILKIENPWSSLYKADRFTPIKSAAEFIKENANVMKQYLEDLPLASHSGPLQDVPTGVGKIIEKDKEKLAIFKADSGKIFCVSAVCTHLGCVVDWNDAEGTWDCPCHGSRFKTNGEVIEGPAFLPLKKKLNF